MPQPPKAKRGEIQNAILNVMSADLSMTIAEIAEVSGVPRDKVEKWLFSRSGKRYTKKVAPGVYKIILAPYIKKRVLGPGSECAPITPKSPPDMVYLACGNIPDLEKRVRDYVRDGWQLHGALIINTLPVQYIQTLIRK